MTDEQGEGIRTVTAEFLRPGPPQNQLLSPLTRYLAVCGDARVGEVSVPYEHAEFIRRLRDLRYLAGSSDAANEDRQAVLVELSKDMTQLLSAVPDLAAQLSRHCGAELVHLEFVVTAAELAMLPVELAGALDRGGGDPGSYLQLGAKPLISITRRSRGVTAGRVAWPTHPRILFVSADPRLPVPYAQHVDALLRALQPWLPPLEGPSARPDEERAADYGERLSKQLVILKRATISKIAEVCAENAFTHVHVLAHGAMDPSAPGHHFGLSLHGEQEDMVHVVGGAQFATAIRRDGGRGGPAVVTLAACDSGNVNDVMYTGASFAHELHRSGVPVVVASQLPLSVAGSSVLAEHLYGGLLRGEDPRALLSRVRLRLHSLYAGVSHDWASLVTYAAFPPDFPAQLEATRYYRGREAVDTALDSIDKELSPDAHEVWKTKGEAEARLLKTRLLEKLDDATKLVPITGRYAGESLGLLAAAGKRRAEFVFALGSIPGAPAAELRAEALQALRASAVTYERAFRVAANSTDQICPNGPVRPWVLSQELSLQAVLEASFDLDRWAAVSEAAKDDLLGANAVWGRTVLLELLILRWWIHERPAPDDIETQVTAILGLAREDRFPAYSTARQLRRYVSWWWTAEFAAAVSGSKAVSDDLRKTVLGIADRLQTHGDRRAVR